jgi:hypothetical protein
VNLTNGMEETKAMVDWLKADNKMRPGIAREMYKRWKEAQYPDSFKARIVIQNALHLTEEQLPRIWLYDLRQGGHPIKEIDVYTTSETKVYHRPNIRENFDTKTARNDQNKKLCMPWMLVKSTTTGVPLCEKQ